MSGPYLKTCFINSFNVKQSVVSMPVYPSCVSHSYSVWTRGFERGFTPNGSVTADYIHRLYEQIFFKECGVSIKMEFKNDSAALRQLSRKRLSLASVLPGSHGELGCLGGISLSK